MNLKLSPRPKFKSMELSLLGLQNVKANSYLKSPMIKDVPLYTLVKIGYRFPSKIGVPIKIRSHNDNEF